MLGPVLENLHDDLLQPLVQRTFAIMAEHASIYSTSYVPMPTTTTAKTIGIQTCISNAFSLVDRTSGNMQNLTLASWKYAFIAECGW